MKTPYSTIGRCTRAYPVYEIATSKHCFLKDGWRAHELDPEATILQELAEKKVEHIPIFECGGDVETEATMTDLYVPAPDSTQSDTNPYPPRREFKWKKAGSNKRITRRIHHRFIVNTIGKPLNTFRNSKQLLQVVYDAFKAHRQACEEAQILHRDISAGNILIDEHGRGILIDWDLAKHFKDLQSARNHEITVRRPLPDVLLYSHQLLQGTWQFMSSQLLLGNHTVHTIQDDMESFVYVVLYHGLRYLEHNGRLSVPVILARIFDSEEIDNDGIVRGGIDKKWLFNDPDTILGSGFEFNIVPFDNWWKWVRSAVKQWHDHLKLELSKVKPQPAVTAQSPEVITLEPLRLPPSQIVLTTHKVMDEVFQLRLTSDWLEQDLPMTLSLIPDYHLLLHERNVRPRN
ncbi:hypothetical protein H0H87_009870, partial [Tephrocybe sp. NHM501043]